LNSLKTSALELTRIFSNTP